MNKVYNYKSLILQIVLNLLLFAVLADFGRAAPIPINLPTTPIPGAKPVSLLELQWIVGIIGNFFVTVGPVILVIALIASGITLAGGGASPAAVTKARKWFGASVVGGLIIFGAGVIINTLAAIVTRTFFCRLGFDFGPISVCIIK